MTKFEVKGTVREPTPSAQACKRRAVELLHQRSEFERSRLEKRMSSDDRYYSLGLLDEAQVWATLATVPEPLEGLIAIAPTSQLVFGDNLPPLPVLTCPHGYQARVDTIEAEGRPVQLRYSWNDCPNPSCP